MIFFSKDELTTLAISSDVCRRIACVIVTQHIKKLHESNSDVS